jgi:KipI family sensor histidine kinase inhibitor
VRFLPVRDDTLLIELEDLEAALTLFDALTSEPIVGVGELIPGARTILVPYRPSAVTPQAIVRSVLARDLGVRATTESTLIEIPVRYTGEDLDEVATLLGTSPEAVIAMHTGGDYSVGFTGFAPGFAYLSGGHPDLNVPRRSTPRTRIPAGSVALAGTFSGVYPRESPGGWQLIGTTDVPMWDLDRERPALLLPGDRVRFVDVTTTERIELSRPTATRGVLQEQGADASSALEVVQPGMLTLLQDQGRPGVASMGVSSSGALDVVSLREANRLVGNDVGLAGLEMTFGGLRVRARGSQILAVTGAPAAVTVTRASGTTVEGVHGSAFALDSGDEVQIGPPTSGVRSYLAVRGGFALDPTLGSLSTDVLAGLGPQPLAAGSVLPVAPRESGMPAVQLREGPPAPILPVGDAAQRDTTAPEVVLDVVLGPRTDWFTADAVQHLCGQAWTISARSNRVGLRLEGDALTRVVTSELPSEGTVSGAIQIPPNGQPVLFLADHPLTGGYPVIGAVVTHHLARAGQLPPGARIRFNPLGPFAEFTSAETPSAETPSAKTPEVRP